jgi:putative MATE family efflux protein
MLTGDPFRSILIFMLPMLIGNVFQQLYNMVDSFVVGKFVGEAALAAVSSAFPVVFLIIAIVIGITMGCSTVISQLYGAKRYGEMRKALSTALIALLVVAVVLSLLGVLFSGALLDFMNTDPAVVDSANQYLVILFMGLLATFSYNGLAAAFRAIGDSKTPLYFLIIASVLNIVLDLLFVIGFGMGVAGAAIATIISQGVSGLLCLLYIWKFVPVLRFSKEEFVFEADVFTTMFKLAIPATIQQMIVSFGMIAIQSLINSYGVAVIAGYGAATKIETFVIMPMLNITIALGIYSAQNIGAGQYDRVHQGYNACMWMAISFGAFMTVMASLFGEQAVGLFFDPQKSVEAISVGVSYIKVVSAFYFLFGVMLTANGVLRGAGDMSVFMLSTMTNLAIRVIAAYTLATWIGQSAVWWSVPIGWGSGAVLANARYFSGKWKTKRVIDAALGE